MSRFRFIIFALFVFACSRGRSLPCVTLEEVRRLGFAERPTDAPDSSLAAAGVLGDVRGVVISPDSLIYVLDRYWYRIVAFRADGSVQRIIHGGEGEGPGEFRLPMHLTATESGLSVVDYDLKRVTQFDWSGTLRRTVQLPTPAPWQHLVRGDTAWVTYGAGGSSTEPIFHRVDLVDRSLKPGHPLTPEDQPFGSSVGAAFGAAGDILVNTARPGVWMVLRNGSWIRRGEPLFPDDRAPLTELIAPNQDRVTPAQHNASGIAMIGDSLVVQGITSFAKPFDWNNPPRRDEFIGSLGVFNAEGEHLATLALPAGVIPGYLASDRASGRFFLPTRDPYPQTIEYRLTTCSSVH